MQAQRLVDETLGPPGSANEANARVAAYVVTTFAKYRHTLPDAAGLPSGEKTTDEVIVIEIDGSFAFPMHCYAACPTIESVHIAYDMTRHTDLGTGLAYGSKTPPNLEWLRSFGTPIPLMVGGAAAPS